jgi:NTP pyrophosphatase (non-canonical NTP hydrolase)
MLCEKCGEEKQLFGHDHKEACPYCEVGYTRPKTEKTIRELQAKIAQVNQENGWWDAPEKFGGEVNRNIVKLALISTEIAEAIEATREGDPPSGHVPCVTAFAEELADIVIRTLDLAALNKIELGPVIEAKIRYNATRGYRHGGKLA